MNVCYYSAIENISIIFFVTNKLANNKHCSLKIIKLCQTEIVIKFLVHLHDPVSCFVMFSISDTFGFRDIEWI